ncbi:MULTISPECIES: hypothetical protein [unclassified Acinetobacter]|uniref:hypothetical protein n=1 Tax=unclassified Acinetobacter TaxID=196816 RepID=UPI00124FC9C0|nr:MULTISPECIES: hypothetical protein [unclassified Acinetobacter]
MNFKVNDKVVYEDNSIPNNLVMNVKRGTYTSSGMKMVSVELPSGIAHAFAEMLRHATDEEKLAGIRIEQVK